MLDDHVTESNALFLLRSQKAHSDTASLCGTLKRGKIRQILSMTDPEHSDVSKRYKRCQLHISKIKIR